MKATSFTVALCLVAASLSTAQILPYQLPPRTLVALADVPPMPRVSFSSDGEWLLQMDVQEMPTVADLSQPELRLAGLRLNTVTNSPSRVTYVSTLWLRRLPDGKPLLVQGLPANARISNVQWSPDNSKLAFTHTSRNHMELWVVEVASASARLIPNIFLNGALGMPYEWVSDNKTLIARAVVGGRGQAPKSGQDPTPAPPTDSSTPAPRTYANNLKSAPDEPLLDYYALAQVVRVGLDGRMGPVGQPGLIQQASPSPNGQYVLVRTYLRPYPYGLPLSRFGQRVQVLTMEGLVAKEVAELPAVTELPAGPDAVPTGPREFGWREDVPSTLFWAEAQDGGNAQAPAPVRDRLFTLAAPFDEAPRELVSLPLRYRRMYWGNDQLALIEGYNWAERQETIWTLDPATKTSLQPLFERSTQNTYTDPGTPVVQRNKLGRPVLQTNVIGNTIYLMGKGASPEGDRPFVDELNVFTKKTQRWWRSEAPYYELPVAIIDPAKHLLVTRRESVTETPNYYLRSTSSAKNTALTQFTNPYAGLGPMPQKQLLRYQRADGLVLTAIIYLPAGYKKEDGPLPTLLEAYPTEFKDKVAAGHTSGSLHSFTRLPWASPLYWASQGYAVLQNVRMPVVTTAGSTTPPADYVEQLTAAARAVLEEGRRLGFVDTARVGLVGQGAGAFLTANLLAHTRLFKAGIARPGVHNRPLLPVRLPGEERLTLTTADPYPARAPFSFTDTIRTPLLVLPAEPDTESAGFAAQSEQFYEALQRNGANVRYAALPGESHGYTARESLMQVLWEMNTWFDTYVKKSGAPLPATSKAN